MLCIVFEVVSGFGMFCLWLGGSVWLVKLVVSVV